MQMQEVTTENDANQTRFTLSAALTIDSVHDLAQELKNILAVKSEGANLVIDASAVEVITTPGVQMIIALGKVFERSNGEFSISNPSEAFKKAFETLGLEQLLAKWSGING